MEAPRVLSVAVLAVAAVLLVPTFNALNEQRLGDLKPPIELKDPPPDVEPPPDFQPPPVAPPCQQESDAYGGEVWSAPGSDGLVRFAVREGALQAGFRFDYQQYRGNSAWQLLSPTGSAVASGGSSLQATVLSPQTSSTEDEFTPTPGEWRFTFDNAGVAGAAVVNILVVGCYFPEGQQPGAS